MITEPPYMLDLEFDAPTHVYRYRKRVVPHITEVVPDDYDNVPPHVLEKARQRGHEAHKATELYDLRNLNWQTVNPTIEPYLDAWIKFRREYEMQVEPQDVERRLYHPVYNYAGTGDRPRCLVRGKITCEETKTIALMTDEVGLQVAAQVWAENHRARVLGLPEIEQGLAVQLRKDGTFRPTFYTMAQLKQYFQEFWAYLIILNREVRYGKKQYAVSNNSIAT